ncbi:MAG: VanW family protein [Patescibacteria group bacterium]
MKAFLGFLVSLLVVFLMASSMLAFDLFKRQDLVLPRTVFGDVSLAGLNRQEARDLLKQKMQEFLAKPMKLAARGEVQEVSLRDLGISINERLVFEQIPFAKSTPNIKFLLWSLGGQRIMPQIAVSRTELLRIIQEKFPNIPQAKSAHFERDKKNLKITPSKAGVVPIIEPLLNQIEQNIAFLEPRPLLIEFKETAPTVTADDLKKNQPALTAALPKKIKLTREKESWEADFEKHPEWISFEWKNYEVAKDELPLSLQWDAVAFSQFLNAAVSKSLERPAEDVNIVKDENGKISFEGHGNEGRAIEREHLLALVDNAIANKTPSVEIPLITVSPKVEVTADLQDQGIRELIAVGHTRFAGSPVNRAHNIGVGIAKFNGELIPPGETFSFGKVLGVVDGSTGYRKELVIKPEGTIPEYGGGICQVSSTMYRAALFAGLPIVERRAHSYAVSYYSQILGHGLDATVYPPSPDLKFKNDTPGAILIQAYVDGDDAYFKFYGTSDGRSVAMIGPVISNQRSAPAEPLLVPDLKLKPGEKKQVEKAHGGFDALWQRIITTKDGHKTEEKIVSKYQAVPNKFLVGGDLAPPADAATAQPVNPFE